MGAGLAVLLPVQLAAQEAESDVQGESITAEEALIVADEVWKLEPGKEEEVDPCDQPDDPDVILVCRESVDPAQYMFERSTRADSEVTGSGAPRAPNLDNSCLATRGRENCNMFGSVPEPALMIDFDELPETPEGSEAARLYGGPTAARETPDTIVSMRRPDMITQAGEEEDEERDPEIDPSLETQIGLDDDIFGP